MSSESLKRQAPWRPKELYTGPPAKLILKDGKEFHGYSFGYENPNSASPSCLDTTGEVVFSTAMLGYYEAVTDPSFVGQILVLTYPLIGNVGVPENDVDEYGLLRWFESASNKVRGLVICDYCINDSHWRSTKTFGAWLKEKKIPAIAGIDTRALTKHLRNFGSTFGRIVLGEEALAPTDPALLQDGHFFSPNDYTISELFVNVKPTLYSLVDVDSKIYLKKYEFTEQQILDLIAKDPYILHTAKGLEEYCIFDGTGKYPVESFANNADYIKNGRPKLLIIVDCGIKNSIIRSILQWTSVGTKALIVPSAFDFTKIEYDGLFLSNGPGNPEKSTTTIKNVRAALKRPTPIFGICLGNQILALSAGAKVYKMLYGNRGFNQPCIDLRTYKCYATIQNHGYAIDRTTLPEGWAILFENANDHTVEGIVHKELPWFSVQFHPEVTAGPTDTTFLIRDFMNCIERNTTLPLHIRQMSTHVKCKRILLLSSGGLSIGQAGEFDYSGSQAIKALKEAGAKVILVNPNVATVQTSGMADVTYFLPITFEYVSEIIRKERPDGIMCGFGGQTGLNCGIELWRSGILKEFSCEVLGTSIETILDTEDRARFSQKMQEIDERCAPSLVAASVQECLDAAERLGYPVLVRGNFELGGFGSGFANCKEELLAITERIFNTSGAFCIANSEGSSHGEGTAESIYVHVDKSLCGWKEIEFEILRDSNDNCVCAASMENFDPLGIHTGDSIVVAPAQTLNGLECYKLREVAFKVVRHLGIVGECNIQFAVDTKSEEYFIVELNARLSRSSALASKATGYPLAYMAAKVALGYDLVQMRNCITHVTTACYEPSLDYLVVKLPKWDLKKFEFADTSLGSCMKSVGEVMSIGRTFEEAMQKAIRMGNDEMTGFEAGNLSNETLENVIKVLKHPTPDRVAAIFRAFELGLTVKEISAYSLIDPWFIHKLHNVFIATNSIKEFKSLKDMTASQMYFFKTMGFSDKQIAKVWTKSESAPTEDDVRAHRKALGILPFVKLIDTLAAEYPAKTNYCYLTYNGVEHDVVPCKPVGTEYPGIIVLGCGPYRIGSSIEFDWSAVGCIKTLRNIGHAAIIVNCNPETVSTDFDVSDRLYFEELTTEIVDAIYQFENPYGIIISVGGQTANNLACKLSELGTNVLGTSVESIDKCECRNKFSEICDILNIDQPPWEEFTSVEGAREFCKKVCFPVLVRPSYVLSGASMRVITSFAELDKFLQTSAVVNRSHPVVISKFIENAKEVEMDCVAQHGIILNYAISEHVEYAGTHSGDATLLLPAQNIFVDTHRRVKKITQKLSRHLNISGPFNVQFMCKNGQIKIIECNLRASRTLPFISKTFNVDFIDLATRVMVGAPFRVHNIQLMDLDYVAIKMPVFSFDRLHPADPLLGVEMKSTGEIAAFGASKYEAILKAMIASGRKMPKKGVLLSLGSSMDKFIFAKKIRGLLGLGLDVYATEGTFDYVTKLWSSEKALSDDSPDAVSPVESAHNVQLKLRDMTEEVIDVSHVDGTRKIGKFYKVFKPSQKKEPSALDALRDGKVDLFINVSDTVNSEQTTDGYIMRRAFVNAKVTLISSTKLATLLIDALMLQDVKISKGKTFLHAKSHHEYMS
ncbi:glutamine-dependent carbamoyl phosphate synthase, putative [Theileria equi strain WA]|uniref:Glutamine-dependent carbamoyl phosphate synthase, putative n=1 Tax=Theileria equi strain WA TaxID=1537102 RepID=L1L9R7_THEEQ|nr:glutamine-dependent carbamoyl phosphate synthase, putative [Theileria equi strain WA]EKX71994.1 glutamine-dependent carbamoyl phosphate synthase, putative [Theileria equi strain WA]|eukprot:XP_004831446.1 glutamine-dependent carbamoyl phosphate synthase, putative [Theileria equi strain WA]